MQPILRPLVVLHGDVGLRDQLRRTGQKRYQYREVEDWEALRAALQEEMPVAIVVVDPYRPDHATLATELRSLIWEFPTVTVFAAGEANSERKRERRRVGVWGHGARRARGVG